MCSLVHVCDDKNRLRFTNPAQINQLELNLVTNEKSETFKGMSNKKRVATIKKAQQKLTKEKKRSSINPHRSTNAAVQRQRMYHDPL
jgi:hypothetical protein